MKKTVIWFIFLIAILPVSLSKIHTQDDQYYASFGKIYHKLLSSNGQSFELQNTQQKLEVLWNDRLEPSDYATCSDQVSAKQMVKTAAYFEDATKDSGIKHVHQHERAKRPNCAFDYVILGDNTNSTSRLFGELCMMEMLTGGAAVGDYDNDGWEDIYFTVHDGRGVLYRNMGDGTFLDVTEATNVGPSYFGSGAGWIDIDADGDLDLFVSTAGDTRHYLYVNYGGYFTEEAVARGTSLQFANKRKIAGMTPNFGDFDLDGYIDIYVSEWIYHTNTKGVSASRLLKNMGAEKPGYFIDVTNTANVSMDKEWSHIKNKHSDGIFTFGASFTDFNNDGWPELLVTGDWGQSRLFWNNKNGTFTECTHACGITGMQDAMGHAIGDFNQDGFMDIFLSAIYWTNTTCQMASCAFGSVGSGYYQNNGNGTFKDMTKELGVENNYWAWGASFLDYNNDMQLDLAVTNGFDSSSTTLDDYFAKKNTQLFQNVGKNSKMVDTASSNGISFDGLGRGLLVFDYDKDGDEDLVIVSNVGPPLLYKNVNGNTKNWLRVLVKQRCLNTTTMLCDSYGAVIKITTYNGVMQTHHIGSKSHFFGQSELMAHFGLGTHTHVATIEVSWPIDSKKILLHNVTANQNLRVVRPNSAGFVNMSSSLNKCEHLQIESISQQPTIGKVTINSDKQSLTYNPQSVSLFDIGLQSFKYRATINSNTSNYTSMESVVKMDFRVSPDIYGPCKDGRLVSTYKVIHPTTRRKLNGKSNNLKNVHWGSANENLIRLAGHAYGDNVSEPSGACTVQQKAANKCPYPNEFSGIGSNRPSPRFISNELMAQTENVWSRRNLSDLTMHWGQYLAHDLDHTSFLPRFENSYFKNHVWMPITVPKGDVHFDPFSTGKESIPFTRSTYNRCTGQYPGTTPREHPNKITAYLDANMVYGVTESRCRHLRTYKDGLMIVDANNYMPKNTAFLGNENPMQRPIDELYLAGDIRANVQPGLMALHTLFLREHNRLAAKYKMQNPEANDERIFQEARRFVIAETQAIVFNEYLPAILGGAHYIPKYRGYNSSVDVTIATEFSTSAFRYGHSEVNTLVYRLGADGSPIKEGNILLRDVYFKPNRLENEGGLEPVLRGATAFPAQEIDLLMVDEMRNTLFPTSAATPGKSSGFDLASINIQRGRDHGLPDYNTVREKLGLKRYKSFTQITSHNAVAARLQNVYKDIDNIDLWVGGLAEDHVPNSSLGETFHKIVREQFLRIRDGDRFWYQRNMSSEEIKKVEGLTLSKIIQLNTEFKDCPEHVFFSSNNCKGTRNHQCIPKNAESESVIEDSESVVRENNKKDNTILGLVVTTVILAVLFLIALGMVLHMTYIKNKKTVEDTPTTVQKKKDSMAVQFSLGIQNEAMTDGSM